MSIADNINKIATFVDAARKAGVSLDNGIKREYQGRGWDQVEVWGDEPRYECVVFYFEAEGQEVEVSLPNITGPDAERVLRAILTAHSLLG